MTTYIDTSFNLSDNQRNKLRRAIENGEEVNLLIKRSQAGGPDVLKLTSLQHNKFTKLNKDKGMVLKLSKTQLKKQPTQNLPKTELFYTLTKVDAEKLYEIITKILNNKEQVGGFLGSLIKTVLPMLKNILPKVLGTLGLSAASGAISGATHRATSGRGLRRAGYGISLSKPEVSKLLDLANKCEHDKIAPKGTVKKCERQIKQQKGGFISALLASLAGSLLPTLLSGNGLYRAGGKKK